LPREVTKYVPTPSAPEHRRLIAPARSSFSKKALASVSLPVLFVPVHTTVYSPAANFLSLDLFGVIFGGHPSGGPLGVCVSLTWLALLPYRPIHPSIQPTLSTWRRLSHRPASIRACLIALSGSICLSLSLSIYLSIRLAVRLSDLCLPGPALLACLLYPCVQLCAGLPCLLLSLVSARACTHTHPHTYTYAHTHSLPLLSCIPCPTPLPLSHPQNFPALWSDTYRPGPPLTHPSFFSSPQHEQPGQLQQHSRVRGHQPQPGPVLVDIIITYHR
jgi:hypothetical protein